MAGSLPPAERWGKPKLPGFMTRTDGEARPFGVVALRINALDLIAVADGHPEPETKELPQNNVDYSAAGDILRAWRTRLRMS